MAMIYRQDVMAALVVGALAAIAMIMSGELDYGSLAEIGPGLFPFALAAILLALCIALAVQGMRTTGAGIARPDASVLRAVACIIGALLVFAITMRGANIGSVTIPSLGIVGAAPLAILLAGLADKSTRWMQLVIFAAALTVFCAVLFRFLLGLPLPLAPWLVGY
jgi:Tripartite tricarboxylate transporter TctB family